MSLVVVTDSTFDPLDVESAILTPLRCELRVHQCRTPAELLGVVGDADQVITQFAPLTAEVLAAMPKAEVIVRYGIGVDNIDLDAARALGIPVCNVPDYCINEVADHTLAFILATTRQVPANSEAVRSGRWGLAVPLTAMRTLAEMTVGIVGFGRIGQEVARRLQAFGCRLLVHDPYVRDVSSIEYTRVSIAGLMADSDIITLHCPATAETRRIINRERIARMKAGVILINVGRGELIDTDALIDGLHDGHIAAAALDVFATEPLPVSSPLLQMNNVIVSAHIASTSVRAMRRLRESVANTVASAVRGEPLPNIVNGLAGRRLTGGS